MRSFDSKATRVRVEFLKRCVQNLTTHFRFAELLGAQCVQASLLTEQQRAKFALFYVRK